MTVEQLLHRYFLQNTFLNNTNPCPQRLKEQFGQQFGFFHLNNLPFSLREFIDTFTVIVIVIINYNIHFDKSS